MAFGREDVSVAKSDGSADVFGLAGFLRDNNLISHSGSFGRIGATTPMERTVNTASSQVAKSRLPGVQRMQNRLATWRRRVTRPLHRVFCGLDRHARTIFRAG